MARVVIHGNTPQQARPATVVHHGAGPAATGESPEGVQIGAEGPIVELGDSMKTRVQHHGRGQGGTMVAGQPVDGGRARVVIEGQMTQRPNVALRQDIGLKAPPPEPTTPEEVLAELEKREKEVLAEHQKIMVAIGYTRARIAEQEEPAAEPAPNGQPAPEPFRTIADAIPIILTEEGFDTLLTLAQTEEQGQARKGILTAIEHRLVELITDESDADELFAWAQLEEQGAAREEILEAINQRIDELGRMAEDKGDGDDSELEGDDEEGDESNSEEGGDPG